MKKIKMTKNAKIVTAVIAALLVVAVLFSVISASLNTAKVNAIFKSLEVVPMSIDFEKDFVDSTQKLSRTNNAGAGWKKYAETSSLELYLKTDKQKILFEGKLYDTQYERHNVGVYDKKAKRLWTAVPDDSKLKMKGLSDSNNAYMQSLAAFEIYNFDKDNNREEQKNVLGALKEQDEMGNGSERGIVVEEDEFDPKAVEDLPVVSNSTVEEIPNGIRINYDLTVFSVKFALDFKIDKDGFDVVVPDDKIEENVGEYDVITRMRSDITAQLSRIKTILNDLTKLRDTIAEDELKKNTGIAIENASDKLHAVDNANSSRANVFETLREFGDAMDTVRNNMVDVDGAREKFDELGEVTGKIIEILGEMSRTKICGLVSVTPIPFFGAATPEEKGYVFYPDKCGSISYFDIRHPENITPFKADIYTNHVSDIRTFFSNSEEDEESENHEKFTSVRMPVFGIKNRNSAFVSIVAEGDSDAAISYTASSGIFKMNYANAMFYMRSKTQTTNSKGETSLVIDRNKNAMNRRIRYLFLQDEKATYSGMAVKYREHLEKYGLITKSKYYETQKEIPMAANFYMGDLFTHAGITAQYRQLTTFPQVQSILEDMSSKGINSVIANLQGWSTSGNWGPRPNYKFTPENTLGGTKGLKELTEYARKNNVATTIPGQFMFGREDYMTYIDRDVATTRNYGDFNIFIKNGRGHKWFMYNPIALYNSAMNATEKAKTYGVDGLTLGAEGTYIYEDYNKNIKHKEGEHPSSAPIKKEDTKQILNKLGYDIKDSLGFINYQGAGINTAVQADLFFGAPETDSRFLISDSAVPFMQIVLHGYVPYTGTHLNNMYDVKNQRLKQIEFGNLPIYNITNDELDSKETYSDELFSTKYSQWSEDIVSTYNEYKTNIGDLWKEKITNHEMLTAKTVRVTYESGTKILVNYNDVAQKIDGTKVPANGYKVVR